MKNFLVLSIVLVLAACGVSSSDGVVSRGTNKGGFAGLSTKSNVEVSGAKALSGVKDVVIGSFKVGFAESSVAKRQAGGGFLGGGMGGKASGKVRLEGVSAATKQAITESAYKDLVAELKSKGYNVISRSKFTGSEGYGKAKKYSFPYKSDKSGFLSKYGTASFYQPKSFGKEGILFMNDIQGVTGGFMNNGDNAAVAYAKANNVGVVSATYYVDFTAADGHGNKWTSSASVKVGQNLAVTTATFKVAVDHTSSFKAGTATVSLGQPIESGAAFGTVKDETSAAMNVTQEAVNVVSMLAGGGSSRSKNYVIQANAGKYKSGAVGVLKKANDAIIAKAASMR